ncbi:MAG: asparagine synthase (glutamine-hydrolyzing) [Pseudomonadota bacterium]
MCGVVGFQGDFDDGLLSRMSAAVQHRGPDGQGSMILTVDGQPKTGFGHRRLAIIDLSQAGCQPMKAVPDEPGGMQSGLTLVFNGEIYNYRELRTQLVRDGHRFESESDSEVLLHLYERDGLAMTERLKGIFAFAIHDAREAGRPEAVERGALFIARDQLGVKPLYYASTRSGFLFGSEIKALLCASELDRAVDSVALHEMLGFLWTPAPRTMLEHVKKLEPGAAMLVSGGLLKRKWFHYTLPYRGDRDERSEADLVSRTAEMVESAVQRQLVSDVPVGAFLSGGLDSSAIVAMMRRSNPDQEITCFTVNLTNESDTDGNPNDLPYARRVAEHLDVQLEEVVVEPDAIRRLPQLIELLDEPQADPAPINALMIAERARAMNIPVLMSGAGGDDIFSGYRRHWALQFEDRWSWLPASARSYLQNAAQAAASGKGRGQSSTLLRRLTKMFSYAAEPHERRLASYFLWSTDGLRRSLYSPEFANEVAGTDTIQPLLTSLRRVPEERCPLQQMLFLETSHFLADHNLNYTDRAGMAVGVEVRVPLLDVDLVDFASRIPAGMKQQGRIGKAIFKKAMEPFLPRDVIYRPKSGFGAPLRRWLRVELRDLLHDVLSEDALARRGYFDAQRVQRLVKLDREGAVDGTYTIFALMCFEIWCRIVLDGQNA